jgi:hypothetical protein
LSKENAMSEQKPPMYDIELMMQQIRDLVDYYIIIETDMHTNNGVVYRATYQRKFKDGTISTKRSIEAATLSLLCRKIEHFEEQVDESMALERGEVKPERDWSVFQEGDI